jgi:hypothetical protein
MTQNAILLNQLLNLSQQELEHTKIRFNLNNGHVDPIEVFKTNPEEVNTNWLLWREKNNRFHVGDIVISLVRISNDHYLFTAVKTITKDLGVHNGVAYDADERLESSNFDGRVIVNFHKNFQASVREALKVIDSLEVTEVLPDLFNDNHFPGYDNVRLSYSQLGNIIHSQLFDWNSALENQKAVYLITDKKSGKLYVGSATAERGMLLERWRTYIKNGHGGDVALKQLVNEKGFDYVKSYFQYSILENYNARVDDAIVLARESWWKLTLGSRAEELGYNRN